MIEVINGTDWSCSKNNGINLHELKFVIPAGSEKQNNTNVDDADDKKQQAIINPYDYFEIYSSLFGNSDKISPVNLGIYLDKEWIIHSTQFVGIMPLTDKNLKPLKHDKEQCVIKIDSRFNISPSMMLKEVLEGDDYYENPGMLQCNSYRISELKELFGKGKKNKVLCGTIKDLDKVTLKQCDDGKGGAQKPDAFLSSVYPIFEIIRFVNLAKEVCKKNLKQQSIYKEENLVGKVKGRILVNKQIKQNLSRGQSHKTYCAYNSLSDNIKENMILKYTLYLCSKLEIADALREDIMFCNRVLSNVPLKKCNISDFVGLKSNGAFRQYKQAMEAARVIINRYYISYEQSVDDNQNNEIGTIKVADYSVEPYFIDMNLLFEYYCRALFRKAINIYNQKDIEYYLKLEPVKPEKKELFNNNNEVKEFYMSTYIPDILVKYVKKGEIKEKVLTVIDAKYSDVEQQYSEKRARTHQVLFYMNVLDSKYGGLISPSKSFHKEYFEGNYLYDGVKENISRQKLCYLPLEQEKPVEKNTYDNMIFRYLSGIMTNKKEDDEKECRLLELENALKSILSTISKCVRKNGEEISVVKAQKLEMLEFFNKYRYILDEKKKIQ